MGGEPVDYDGARKCCGFPVITMNRETSLRQAGTHVGDGLDAGADALVTPCPLCHLNLDMQQPEAAKVVDRDLGLPWDGRRGVVTELLDDIQVDVPRTYAVACGPPVFYKFMLERLMKMAFGKDRIFISLERRMECGVGKCGHCAVGYTFTCLHGPVFSYWDAMNLPELIYT